MFESLPGRGRDKAAKQFVSLLLSALFHGLLVFMIVLLPLVFFRLLPISELMTILIAAPAPPLPPPPPLPAVAQPARDATVRTGRGETIFPVPPEHLQNGIRPPDDEPVMTGALMGIDATGISLPPGTFLGGAGVTGLQVGTAVAPVAPTPPPPPSSRTPLPVGGKVQAAKLIKKVMPEYPDLARRSQVEGDVSLEVNIDEEGNVTDTRVLQGHPLLIENAVRAVRAWKYSPTLLNGEPIPVVSVVTVLFRLR